MSNQTVQPGPAPNTAPSAHASAVPFKPQHVARMQKRAIDPTLAYAEGTRSLDEDDLRRDLRNPNITGGALAYFYGHLGPPHTDFASYVRAYLDDPEANKKKVVVRAGISPPPYFLQSATGHGGPWLVTESPEKALALASHGYAEPVGMGGVDAGMLTKADANGRRALHPLAAHFIRPEHLVFIVMDAGRANNPRVARAEARVAGVLRAHGCVVKLVELPLLDGGRDQGVDDFLAAKGKTALDELFAIAQPGDPLTRACAVAATGADGCAALLKDLPFLAAVAEGGDATVAAVETILAPFVPSGRLRGALQEYEARARGETIFNQGDEVELGRSLVRELGGHALLVFDQGDFHKYADGVWALITRDEAKRLVADYSGAKIRTGDGFKSLKLTDRSVGGAVNLARAEVSRRDFFSGAPRGLVFESGFARVDGIDVVVEPHSPDHRARHRYAFPYDPDARAPRFAEFLATVWEGDEDAAEKQAVLQEYVGASLFGLAARSKKILVLHGDGDTGKSTTLNIMQGIFPPDSVVSIPPQQFRSDYHRAQLAHALINVVAEVPESEWMDPASSSAAGNKGATLHPTASDSRCGLKWLGKLDVRPPRARRSRTQGCRGVRSCGARNSARMKEPRRWETALVSSSLSHESIGFPRTQRGIGRMRSG